MTQQRKIPRISRRGFLKTAVAAAGGLALSTLLAPGRVVSIRAAGIEKLYRGTLFGQIHESLDFGSHWQTVANFGPDFAVLALTEQPAGISAWMMFQGSSFLLKSEDGRTWYTADWQPPASS